jgi:hypothetical protein
MADRFVLTHLKRLPLFAHLTPDQLEWIAEGAQVLRLNPGDIAFKQGQINQGIMMFISGAGTLTKTQPDGAEKGIGAVGAGQFVNESALFVETTASVTLKITEAAIVLFLPRQHLLSVMAQRPDIKTVLRPPASIAPGISDKKAFHGQLDDENVLLICRRHPWVFIRHLWMPVGAGVLLWVLALLIGPYVTVIPAVLAIAGTVIPLLGIGYFFVEWYNDQVIITDRRVIRVENTILNFRTNISEVQLANVHEVNSSIPSTDIFARLFGYGTISIKTTSGMVKFDFIPNPAGVQNVIFTNRNRFQENLVQQNRDAIRGEVNRFLGKPGETQAGQPTGAVPMGTQPRTGFFGTRFVNAKGELVYRKHFLVWLRHVLLPLFICLVGVIVVALALSGVKAMTGGIGIVAGLAILLVGGVGFYLADWDWRNDLYIIGAQTITLIHKRPLWLQNETDKILISEIDNVVSDTHGFVNTLFRLGDVKVMLVGGNQGKVFKSVYDPQAVQQEISNRQLRLKQSQQEAEAARQRQAIVEYLSVYHDSLNQPADAASGQPPPAQPRIQDRSRPPGIPRVRGDNTPNG